MIKKMYTVLYVKYRLFLSGVNRTRIILDRFSKSTQLLNLMKIHPFEALFLADGRTDGYGETNSRFSQFWERT